MARLPWGVRIASAPWWSASRPTWSSTTCRTIVNSSTTLESAMSGASSSGGGWSSRLEPALHRRDHAVRRDDPRLEDVIELWDGNPKALRPGRAVLLGFPQDEGVVRNHGRPG